MKSIHRNLVVGMTGTLMQNNHAELWNLIDLVETDYLGDWNSFKIHYEQPIKHGRYVIYLNSAWWIMCLRPGNISNFRS